MRSSLPVEIEPLALAKRGATLQGKLPLKQMTRLQELVVEAVGDVDLKLIFDQSKFSPPSIVGQIQATLMVECVRCGQEFEYKVDLHPNLRIVRNDEQAKSLEGQQQEPLLLEEDSVNLVKLVEDEILLSLPMLIRHEDNECRKEIGL